MIEIRINKDIGSYKAKFVGPLTLRQTVCVGLAAPVCWFLYSHTSNILTKDIAGFLTAIPAAIAWLFGWPKPYGLPTEKFLKSVFVNMVLAPSHRMYKTVNRQEKALAILKEAENASSRKAKKQRKPKYKVSREAVR